MFRTKHPLPASILDSDLARIVPENELRLLDQIGTMVEIKPGRTVIRQDSAGREAMVVINGSLTVTRDGETIAELQAGDIAGEVALITGGLRNATVTADDDSVVLYAFNRGEFSTLLDSCPAFAGHAAKTAEQRVLVDA